MAVIVIKLVRIGDSETPLKTYQPLGSLSKEEREQADRLDEYLQSKVPDISRIVLEKARRSTSPLRRWYLLGQELRKMVQTPVLLLRADLESGLIWDAVWQYIPDDLKPERSSDATPYSEKRRRRKDHLTLCYEISQFKWADVKWMRRWNDWYEIASRPGLTRDIRVLQSLGKAISGLKEYPSGTQFREIAKSLAEFFPTKQLRDTSGFSDEHIRKTVRSCIERVLGGKLR
jgi:hypothetical protein